MIKLTTVTTTYYDYHEMIHELEKKHNINVRNYANSFAKENVGKNLPYQDFWHWMLSNWWYDDPRRGIIQSLDWNEVYIRAQTKNAEPWVIEILSLLVYEYGDLGEFCVVVDW